MLIGLRGAMGSGKDTVGRRLVQEYGFVRFAFADQLKELCAHAVHKSEIGWNGTDWTGSKTMLGRQILQGIGHGAREVFGPGVWVEALDRAYQARRFYIGDRVVVTDVRYPNEIAWVKDRGGVIVLIRRPSLDLSGPEHQHPTERSVDALPFDYAITNDGTIADLWQKTDMLLAALGAAV